MSIQWVTYFINFFLPFLPFFVINCDFSTNFWVKIVSTPIFSPVYLWYYVVNIS